MSRRHRRRNITPVDNSFNFSKIAEIISNVNLDQLSSFIGRLRNNNGLEEVAQDSNKEREEIINSIKILINSDKIELIRVFIDLYELSKKK